MDYYATFLIKWLPAGSGYFDFLLENKIRPEVGLEYGGVDYSPQGHRELAKALKDNGLGAAVHLPFLGLAPGSADKNLRRQSVDCLLKAAEIAAIYEADHLIGHPEFRAAPGQADWRAAGRPGEDWLDKSQKAWEEVLNATEARLYLENTEDQSPEAILSLLTRLPERAAMCFDVGHWYCAAHGRDRQNLAEWLTPIAQSARLAHLHLHDNDGEADRHWALGRGGIDFTEYFTLLKQYRLRPAFTLESHTLERLKESRAWLRNDPPGADVLAR